MSFPFEYLLVPDLARRLSAWLGAQQRERRSRRPMALPGSGNIKTRY
jgi:hypothetical protein